ncbi:hypothetical protein JOB18_020888 [Solea senegalensis]|uniref:Polyadenylate-binding protein-interacting protein 2 n=2 Tax=Solea senegalensis TaxID=28829 RepID=A0AAV6PGR9_SOLSE|nr:hypothetical protein JOB18_020888 [Solea senegalensis]
MNSLSTELSRDLLPALVWQAARPLQSVLTRCVDCGINSLNSANMTISNQVILSSDVDSDADPFAEYMWMENEEEFDRQVEEELWEEEFIEHCFQEMLEEEEQWEWFIPSRDLPLQGQVAQLDSDVVVNSSLNPNAKEFTPGIKKHVM